MGAGSEVDTELQDSKADFSSDATQVQCALFSITLSALVHSLCLTRDSPYPEVRAAVSNTDDPTMIVNTFRV